VIVEVPKSTFTPSVGIKARSSRLRKRLLPSLPLMENAVETKEDGAGDVANL
jgi:hypothetical protein